MHAISRSTDSVRNFLMTLLPSSPFFEFFVLDEQLLAEKVNAIDEFVLLPSFSLPCIKEN